MNKAIIENLEKKIENIRRDFSGAIKNMEKSIAELKRQQEIDMNVFNDSLVFNSLGIRFVKSMRTMMLVDGGKVFITAAGGQGVIGRSGGRLR